MADEKPAEPAEETLEARVERLTKELADERGHRTKGEEKAALLERTLAALGSASRPSSQPATGGGATSASNPPLMLAPLAPESFARLKQMLGEGWTDDEVRKHYQIITPFFAEVAAPLVQQIIGAVTRLYDDVDRHDVHLTKKDLLEKYGDEMEQERTARRERGEPAMPRAELLEVVRARHRSEEIAAEVASRLEQERQRTASAGAAEAEGGTTGGVQKAGPAATKGPKPKLTDEQLAALPRDERIKALEDMAGDGVVP